MCSDGEDEGTSGPGPSDPDTGFGRDAHNPLPNATSGFFVSARSPNVCRACAPHRGQKFTGSDNLPPQRVQVVGKSGSRAGRAPIVKCTPEEEHKHCASLACSVRRHDHKYDSCSAPTADAIPIKVGRIETKLGYVANIGQPRISVNPLCRLPSACIGHNLAVRGRDRSESVGDVAIDDTGLRSGSRRAADEVAAIFHAPGQAPQEGGLYLDCHTKDEAMLAFDAASADPWVEESHNIFHVETPIAGSRRDVCRAAIGRLG